MNTPMPTAAIPRATQKRDLLAELNGLIAAGLSFSTAVQAFGVDDSKSPHLAYARARYHKDGDREFDDVAVISEGSDPGVYVMCWQWVSHREAGVACTEFTDESDEG